MRVDRRAFLRGTGVGLAGAAAGAAVSGTAVAVAEPDSSSPTNPATLPAVPFHGEHQAGILTPQPPAAMFAAFDVTAANRSDLVNLFQTLTDRARFLTTGGTPPDLGPGSPPSDSGTLGTTVPADALTLTVGVGSSLFDDRYGLGDRMPVRLSPMKTFPNDDLDPAWCHGDLVIQFCAGSKDTVVHAIRDIAKHTRGGMQLRWRMDGFQAPPRPSGTPRNLLGFKDGIANPEVSKPDVANQLLWVTPGLGEPAWALGGSYHVCRLIRMFVEFWDRVSITEQENMFGRRRDTGAPLDANNEFDAPDYGADPDGKVIPLNSHIRLANPRTAATATSRILRRGYNYDRGVDLNGNLDLGLVFNCFQQDVIRQFEATQTRLIDEPLVDYISPFGGGYFFTLPGVRDANDHYARGLLA